MRQKKLVRSMVLLAAGMSLAPVLRAAQTPEAPSIADAARRNREQKKDAPRPATVITNDTLKPATPQTVNSQPATAAPEVRERAAPIATDASSMPTAGAEASSPAAADAPKPTAEGSEKLKAEVAALQQQFKDKQSDVDLLRRLLALDQDALLSKPDADRDANGKAKVEAEQSELTMKNDELEQLKAKLKDALAAAPDIPGPAEAPPPQH